MKVKKFWVLRNNFGNGFEMGGMEGKRATEKFYFVVVIKATPPLHGF